MNECRHAVNSAFEYRGENFTHKSLWSVVNRQIGNAIANESGSFYDLLPAMTFALLAFEAYLNFLGERLSPDIWAKERDFFKRDPYRGFDGRVRKVFELCKLTEPDRKQRPYMTIWILKELRDFIAHGRVEKVLYGHGQLTMSRDLSNKLYSLVSMEKAQVARSDVMEIAQMLHDGARAVRSATSPPPFDPWFGDHPFEGTASYRAGYLIPPS